MKRAGIITFHCADNLGAVLQAYALARVVDSLGVKAELIDYIPAKLVAPYGPFSNALEVLGGRGPLAGARALLSGLKNLRFFARRRAAFAAFRAAHLPISRVRYRSSKALLRGAPHYDFYITGSDQVWNPDFFVDLGGAYFLDFAPATSKKLSYAASIANKHVEDFAAFFKEHLPRFDAVSVRERSSVEFVSRFTEKPVQVTLDPSLLLSRQQWLDIAVAPGPLPRFILVYDLVKEPRLVDLVNKLALANDCKVISFSSRKGYLNWHGSFATANPTEFLGLLEASQFVVTSSFHGTAFSVLFNKPFYTLLHPERGQRMQDLLTGLGLDDRVVTDPGQVPETLVPLDFGRANGLLDQQRQASLEYLKTALVSGIPDAD
jgi:hypothetical protein